MVIKTTLTAKNYNATLKPALKLFKSKLFNQQQINK